jgi:hypothetical protein
MRPDAIDGDTEDDRVLGGQEWVRLVEDVEFV